MDATTKVPTTNGSTIPVRAVGARAWLRVEGAATFGAGIALYGWLGGPWLAVVPLLLVPDLSMVGYLAGPRAGALVYNAIHVSATGLAILGVGLATGVVGVSLAGAILLAHSGMDRLFGYGLKLPSGFNETHLGRIGRSR